MKTSLMTAAVAALLLAVSQGLALPWAMVEPYGDGHITPMSRDGKIDKDLEALMNFPGRVYGEHRAFSEIGDWEDAYFAGSTQEFNVFLQQYAKLNYKPLTLYVRNEPAIAKKAAVCGVREDVRYDWCFMRYIPGTKPPGEPSVSLELCIGGGIDAGKVIVPPNVDVKSGKDGPDPEVDRFVERHKRKFVRSFGIYLFKNKDLNAKDASMLMKLSLESLEEDPLIGMEDIIAYTWADRRLEVRPEVLKRLPKPGVFGIPFVFVVSDKPIYQGAIMSYISSWVYPYPTLMVDFVESGNSLTISPCYPGPSPESRKSDLRCSPAIKAALKKAGKLK